MENPKSFLPLPAHFGRDVAISKIAALASLSFSLKKSILDSVEIMQQEWRTFHDIGSQKLEKQKKCLDEQEVTRSPEFEWLLAVACNKASTAFDSFLGQELTDRVMTFWLIYLACEKLEKTIEIIICQSSRKH